VRLLLFEKYFNKTNVNPIIKGSGLGCYGGVCSC